MRTHGGVGAHWVIRRCRGVRGILGAGRECRYSGARRGIGGIRGHFGVPRGIVAIRRESGSVGGVRGVLETGREYRYSGPEVV